MPLRYLGAVALVLAAIFGVGLVTSWPARAAGPAPLAAPPAGETLTQVAAGTWVTTVYLDTAALCAGPSSFDLVTDTPDSDTPAPDPRYDGDSAPQCGAETAHAVTEVALTFTPSPPLTAVPEAATLVVTPPAVSLAAGDPPLELALTVSRQVSMAEYVWIPYGSGAALAALLVLLAAITGLPGADRRVYGLERRFWRTPLYSKSTDWSSTSWVTNLSAVSGLAGTVLAASGTIAGLLPGVDIGRFGLSFAVAGAIAALAPLIFTLLNAHFGPVSEAPAGKDDEGKVMTRAWIMLVASSLTAFGIGAEIGIVGWVICFDLAVAPLYARLSVGVAAYLLALLFLVNGLTSIRGAAQGTTPGARLRRSFVL